MKAIEPLMHVDRQIRNIANSFLDAVQGLVKANLPQEELVAMRVNQLRKLGEGLNALANKIDDPRAIEALAEAERPLALLMAYHVTPLEPQVQEATPNFARNVTSGQVRSLAEALLAGAPNDAQLGMSAAVLHDACQYLEQVGR